jgi:hypothetical protein
LAGLANFHRPRVSSSPEGKSPPRYGDLGIGLVRNRRVS